jgi:hypothetical protein
MSASHSTSIGRSAVAACGLLVLTLVSAAAKTEAADTPPPRRAIIWDSGHVPVLAPEDRLELCVPQACPGDPTSGPAVCPTGTSVLFVHCARRTGEACGWTFACQPDRCLARAGEGCGYGENTCDCGEGLTCERPRRAPDSATGTCVPALPCVLDGKTYQPGERFDCDCNACRCISGEWIESTLMLCGPR